MPTGSQGASPKAHLSCRVRYRLSCRAASRLASEMADLGVVAFGALLEAASDGLSSVVLLVVAPWTAAALRSTRAIRMEVCGRPEGDRGRN